MDAVSIALDGRSILQIRHKSSVRGLGCSAYRMDVYIYTVAANGMLTPICGHLFSDLTRLISLEKKRFYAFYLVQQSCMFGQENVQNSLNLLKVEH